MHALFDWLTARSYNFAAPPIAVNKGYPGPRRREEEKKRRREEEKKRRSNPGPRETKAEEKK
jgi:hypothetical protein